jgi:spore coat protein U-like protein
MSEYTSNRSGARRVRACLALTALAAFICRPAHALVTSCTVAATTVVFGVYTPLTSASSTGTLTLTCDVVLSSSVTISLTTGASGTFTQRTMTSGANTLGYNLYIDAAHTIVWGDGTGVSKTDMVTVATGVPSTTNVTVYGLVPSQDPAPGSYSDAIITVSVAY